MQQIRDILSNRNDSEHEQALVRLAIAALIILYTAVGFGNGWIGRAAAPIIAVYGVFLALACVLFVSILVRPRCSPIRRTFGAVLDMSGLGASLCVLGAAGAVLYPVYLWVIVGNGLRYGQRYLYPRWDSP